MNRGEGTKGQDMGHAKSDKGKGQRDTRQGTRYKGWEGGRDGNSCEVNPATGTG